MTYRSSKAYKSKLYLFTCPLNSTVIVHVIPDQGPLIHWEKGENTNTCTRDIRVTKGIPTNTLRKCRHFSLILVFHLLLKDNTTCFSPLVFGCLNTFNLFRKFQQQQLLAINKNRAIAYFDFTEKHSTSFYRISFVLLLCVGSLWSALSNP